MRSVKRQIRNRIKKRGNKTANVRLAQSKISRHIIFSSDTEESDDEFIKCVKRYKGEKNVKSER